MVKMPTGCQMVDVNDLVPFEKNPKNHTDKDFDIKYRQMAKPYPKKDNACLVQEQNTCVPVSDGGASPTNTHQDLPQTYFNK